MNSAKKHVSNKLFKAVLIVAFFIGFFPALAFSQKIYWSLTEGGEKLQRANLDGTGQEDLVTGIGHSTFGLALDVGSGKMYWTQTDRIRRANLDGTVVENVITGLPIPAGVALDLGAGKKYWTEFTRIRRANLDGSVVEPLVIGLTRPGGIALDLTAGKIYWVNDLLTGLLQRANLDGSAVETLVSGLNRPSGVALDVCAGKVYWTEFGLDIIKRANLDGTGEELLVDSTSGLKFLIALDVDAGKMYWTLSQSKIKRANLDGTVVETVVNLSTEILPATAAIALDLRPDSDCDGIPDDEDACVFSDLSDNVVVDGCDSGVQNVLLDDGCTISDLIGQCAEDADNYGEFVSNVSNVTNYLKKGEIISGKEKGMIQKCAANADIP